MSDTYDYAALARQEIVTARRYRLGGYRMYAALCLKQAARLRRVVLVDRFGIRFACTDTWRKVVG